IIKNTQLLILCMLTLGSTIQTEIVADAHYSQDTEQQDPSEITVTKAFSQLQQIDTFVAQLALLITKGSIKNLSNPKEIITILRDIRSLIGNLSKEQMAIIAMKDPSINEQLTAALTHICDELTAYLTKGLNNKLKGLKPFDVAALTKRGFPKKPTRYGIKQSLQKIDNKITSLQHAIDNVGLTWYNKVARKADTLIVTPAANYYVPTIALYGGMASLVTAYTIWQYGDQLRKNPEQIPTLLSFIKPSAEGEPAPFHFNIFKIHNLQKWFGHALPSGNHALNPTEDQKKYLETPHPYAVFELMVRETLLGINPLTAMACGYAATSFYKDQWPAISNKFIEKRNDIWNFLRGGQFINQSSHMAF